MDIWILTSDANLGLLCLGAESAQEGPVPLLLGGNAMRGLTSHDGKGYSTFSVLLEGSLVHMFTSGQDKEEKRNEPSDCYSITYRYLEVSTIPEGTCPDWHNCIQQ